jgi:hypothetical protein
VSIRYDDGVGTEYDSFGLVVFVRGKFDSSCDCFDRDDTCQRRSARPSIRLKNQDGFLVNWDLALNGYSGFRDDTLSRDGRAASGVVGLEILYPRRSRVADAANPIRLENPATSGWRRRAP